MRTPIRIKRTILAAGITATLLLSAFANARVAVHADNAEGGVLLGPCGVPGAEGPTGTNDDFTNRSLNAGIINTGSADITDAGGSVIFRNTIQNIGTGDDVFIITSPTVPNGFNIEISIDDGASFVPVDSTRPGISLPIAYRAAAIFYIRVVAPAGLKALTGYDTVIRATSTITPTVTNDTIDRLYTGFIRLDESFTVTNATGIGGPTDLVSGAELEFAITYTNISSAQGVGSSLLTAHNLLINEDGRVAPNNWGATTEHVVGASDTLGGYIAGDRPGSAALSDIVMSVEPGQSGIFKFKRRIK
jgi:hypothetical protein